MEWSVTIPLTSLLLGIAALVIKAIFSKPKKECCLKFGNIDNFINNQKEIMHGIDKELEKTRDMAVAANRRLDEKTNKFQEEIREMQKWFAKENEDMKSYTRDEIQKIATLIDEKFNTFGEKFKTFDEKFNTVSAKMNGIAKTKKK